MLKIAMYCAVLVLCAIVVSGGILKIDGVVLRLTLTLVVLLWLGFKIGKAVTAYRRDKLRYLNKILD